MHLARWFSAYISVYCIKLYICIFRTQVRTYITDLLGKTANNNHAFGHLLLLVKILKMFCSNYSYLNVSFNMYFESH